MKKIIIILLGIISISFASIFIKFCQDVPSLIIATYRLIISSALLILISIFNKNTIKSLFNLVNSLCFVSDFFYLVLGGLFLSLHFITWISSLKYTSVSSSVFLVSTSPIFVSLSSHFILKEKQHKNIILGVALSFIGAILLTLADSNSPAVKYINKNSLAGNFLALLGAIFGSSYILIGRRMRKRLDLMPYITFVYTIAGIFLLIFSMISRFSFTGYAESSYVYMVLLAIIPQLFGHTSFNWALKHIKATIISILLLGEPIGASFLAYLFFKEGITYLKFFGILLILFSIIISIKNDNN